MDTLLPALFDIMYDNMIGITQSENSRDDEFAEWFREVSPTMQFSGTANMEMYNYNTSNNTYDKDSRQTAKVSAVASISYNDTICQIKMTDLSVGTQKVSNVDFVTYFESATNTISPNEDYLTGGICTFNGTANTALDAACFTGKITNQTLNLTTIYFTIGNKLFKGTFQGTQMQQ